MIDINKALEFFEERHDTSLLPYSMVTDSGNLGPHVVIFGATHGNEVIGVQAIIEYVNYIEVNQIPLKKGRITWVLGNPEAFRSGKRFHTLNMNRAYTALLEENPEHDRVKEVRKYMNHATNESSIEVVLDLHSVSMGDFKIAICLNNGGENYAKMNSLTTLGSRFTCTNEQLPGSLLQEASDYGAFGMAIECGNHHDIESAHTALWHINKILLEYDIIEESDLMEVEDIPAPSSLIHFTCIEPIKPGYDFQWHIPKEQLHTGSKIEKHQVYAINKEKEFIAPEECVLFVPDPSPHPEDFDAGFLANVEVSIPELYTDTKTTPIKNQVKVKKKTK
jgi:hypothetical protein